MATTVGNHQQGAFTTPINGTTGDASEVLANDNALRTKYDSHDNDPGIHLQSSVLASRPAAGTAGVKWLTSDGLLLYYDDGAAWQDVGVKASAVVAGTFGAGNYTFPSNLGVTGKITTALTPSVDSTDDLGNKTGPFRWRDVFANRGHFSDSGAASDLGASVGLGLLSTTKAFLLPELNVANVVTPLEGMLVLNIVSGTVQVYYSGAWRDVP